MHPETEAAMRTIGDAPVAPETPAPGLSAPLGPENGGAAEAGAADTAGPLAGAQYARNVDYYRGLVDRIGELFGEEARTADDGSVHDSILRAKVPDLVADLRARLAEAEGKVLHWTGTAAQYAHGKDEAEQRAAAHLDAMELAWGIIANAGGGDWSRETTDWQEAAARWRRDYLRAIGAHAARGAAAPARGEEGRDDA